MKRRLVLPAVVLFLIGILLGASIRDGFFSSADSAQLQKVEEAYSIIVGRYVDDVDSERLTESAIYGMLDGLDPHSTYIPREEIKEMQDGFRGDFGGVGIWYEVVADTPRVSSTVANGPSERAGVQSGDRIVTISGTSSVGDSVRTVQKRLKGKIGTEVQMAVRRRGIDAHIPITITRGRIPLLSIDAAYMLDDTTGVIKIGRFASTTHREFVEKATELREHGMSRLIVDLRNNPGGIMETSVQIADEFLPAGFDIVTTKSRHRMITRTERSTAGGQLETMPVVVLINEISASASEILAGALQDNDRGILVGERTFGKALVQQQFALDDGSYMHLTVSRYYTPSGRLIQTPYDGADMSAYLDHKFDNGSVIDAEKLPDSLRYTTRHGRIVAGGGGIFPDHFVAVDTTSILTHPLFRVLNAQIADVRFVRSLFDLEQDSWRQQWDNRQAEFIKGYELEPDVLTDFWAFVEEKSLLGQNSAMATPAARAEIAPALAILLKARIAQNLFDSSAYYPVIQSLDADFRVAERTWPEARTLAARFGTF